MRSQMLDNLYYNLFGDGARHLPLADRVGLVVRGAALELRAELVEARAHVTRLELALAGAARSATR